AIASQAAYALQQESRTIPIVFTQVADPIGAGFVDSLARPGGNTTGFTSFEYGFAAKWLELLKQIAPGVKRVAVLRDPANPAGSGQWGAIQSAASSSGVELTSISTRVATDEIERAIAAFARQPNGGLIMTGSTTAAGRRDPLVALITRQKLPAIYPYRYYTASGGLFSYGPDTVDQYRRGLRRSYSQGREAGRSSGASTDQVRTGDQSQDGQGARHNGPTNAACASQRRDRIKI